MQDSERIESDYCTPPQDPRPRLRWRFVASIIILGFMSGVMLGKLFEPAPLRLETVEPSDGSLVVWFNREPELISEQVLGTLHYRFANAYGREQAGQLQVRSNLVNWRVERNQRGDLQLVLVAPRPLSGQWRGAAEDGRWRVDLALRLE